MKEKKKNIPVEVVFHPNWWNKHYGMKFNEDYFFDPQTRIKANQQHRQILFDRFGMIGLGEENAEEKPVMGSIYIAAGFLISALLGCKINFSDENPPEVEPRNMTDDEAWELKVPDVEKTYPMNKIISLMDKLEEEYGYVEGDINWQGLLNVALDLRGQMFLMDYYTNPKLVEHLLDIIYETTIKAVNIIRNRTKTSSLSVNRIVGAVDDKINLHSNCSVAMISKDTYDEFHLDYEKKLAKNLQPYGIHHCGNDMHKVAESYAKVNPVLLDVGWGSNISFCREKLPNAVLSLRMDPVQMNNWKPKDVDCEVRKLINSAGDKDKIALCCVNMDANVPDENVIQLFETVSLI